MNRILLLLEHRENSRLLSEWLATRYEVVVEDWNAADGLLLSCPFDLCILGARVLDQLWQTVQARRAAEQPVLLPFLLVTGRQDVKYVTRDLWQSIDELIIQPIEKVELQARVEILLRSRQLSLQLKATNQQLEQQITARQQAETNRDQAIAAQQVDLMQRKQAEAAQRESDARLRFALESAQIGEWELDLTAEPYCIRRSLIHDQIFGYDSPLPAWSYKTFLNHVHPNDRVWVDQRFQRALAAHEDWDCECRIVCADGSLRWIWVRGNTYRNTNAAPSRLLGIVVDITNRKAAEVALQEKNERLALLSTIANHLLQEQPQNLGGLLQQLSAHLGLEVYFNYLVENNRLRLNAYGGISEATAKEIEWIECGEAVCGTVVLQQPIVVEEVQRLTHYLADLIHSLGMTAYACFPLIGRGKVLGTLSFGTRHRTRFQPDELAVMQIVCDQVATALERSRLMVELQQRAEELTRANRIKDEFLAVLSHELRSPLNPILGWAKLLQNHDFDATLQKKAIETIERNAKLQSQLIEDLLDISRILNGKLTLDIGIVDLRATVRAALETVQLAADTKSIHIEMIVTPLQVRGDANRLQQVVWNLLSNAIKFTPVGGSVTIKLEQLDSQAQISVSDTGKGIQPDFLPYVFESFRQADGSITRKFGGLGLGLAIVRQVVELHGGTVQAASPGEGQGATFTVRLPQPQPIQVAAPIRPAPSSLPADHLPLSGVQVLLVEDDPDSREFLTFVLEQSGALVTAADSAIEALELLTHSTPDVLLSDIAMPAVDGYELIRQIRSLAANTNKQVPAIALTAYARETDQQQALKAGFQHHLCKPVEPAKLIQAIDYLVALRN
ncbi:response regulator [Phormidium tenue FACHB-886]|nr:response regulator [Phormidium tenue FACHB-886]